MHPAPGDAATEFVSPEAGEVGADVKDKQAEGGDADGPVRPRERRRLEMTLSIRARWTLAMVLLGSPIAACHPGTELPGTEEETDAMGPDATLPDTVPEDVDGDADVEPVGGEGEPCYADATCDAGLWCVDGTCKTDHRGEEKQACRPDGSCDEGLECFLGVCEPLVDDAMELRLPGYHNTNTWENSDGYVGTVAQLENARPGTNWFIPFGRYDIQPPGAVTTCDTTTLSHGNMWSGAYDKYLLFIPEGLEYLDLRIASYPSCGHMYVDWRFVPVSEEDEVVFRDNENVPGVGGGGGPSNTIQLYIGEDDFSTAGWLLVWVSGQAGSSCSGYYVFFAGGLGVADRDAAVASARRWRTRFAPRTLVEEPTVWHGLNDCERVRNEVGSGEVSTERDTYGNADREQWP